MNCWIFFLCAASYKVLDIQGFSSYLQKPLFIDLTYFPRALAVSKPVFNKKLNNATLSFFDVDRARAFTCWGDMGGTSDSETGTFLEPKACYQLSLEAWAKYAEGWYRLGIAGGGIVHGKSYDSTACLQRALELDAEHVGAWWNLGIAGGGVVNGLRHDRNACHQRAWYYLGIAKGGTLGGAYYDEKASYLRALKGNVDDAEAWSMLGSAGGGVIDGVHYDSKACHQRAIELKPDYTEAWSNLGISGGGVVRGVHYDKISCFQRALELPLSKDDLAWFPHSLDAVSVNNTMMLLKLKSLYSEVWNTFGFIVASGVRYGDDYSWVRRGLVATGNNFASLLKLKTFHAELWNNFGMTGGGALNGVHYDPQACYQYALQINEDLVAAWFNLGDAGGGLVRGIQHSMQVCYQRAWYKLGLSGGGIFRGVLYDEKTCYQHALTSDTSDADAWSSLGVVGGGIIHGVQYSSKACYQRALESKADHAQAWRLLAVLGGGVVDGVNYDVNRCYQRAADSKVWKSIDIAGAGNFNNQACFLHHRDMAKEECQDKKTKKKRNACLKQHMHSKSESDCRARHLSDYEDMHLILIQKDFWYNLGNAGGGLFQGVHYDEKECLQRVLELQMPSMDVCFKAGTLGLENVSLGGNIPRVFALQAMKDCYQHYIQSSNGNNTLTWFKLGLLGGGFVDGVFYNKWACQRKGASLSRFTVGVATDWSFHVSSFAKFVRFDSSMWYRLGLAGGGIVNGFWYNKTACFGRALELQDDSPDVWKSFGDIGGGIVGGLRIVKSGDPKASLYYVRGGVHFDSKASYQRALELNPDDWQAWYKLGLLGGGMVGGVVQDKWTCYHRSNALKANDANEILPQLRFFFQSSVDMRMMQMILFAILSVAMLRTWKHTGSYHEVLPVLMILRLRRRLAKQPTLTSAEFDCDDTPMAPPERLREIKVEPVSKSKLRREFERTFKDVDRTYRMALVYILDLLLDKPGGAIVVICDEAFAKAGTSGLRFSEVDQGALRECFTKYCQNVRKYPHRFKWMLGAFRTHSESDRWEDRAVERLVKDLTQSSDLADLAALHGLIGHPSDGALIVSLKAQVLGAAEQLRHFASFKLVKPNGLGLGTRHQSGLAVAERLGGHIGAVMVASDSGGVTLILPSDQAHGAPRALSTKNESHPTLTILRHLRQKDPVELTDADFDSDIDMAQPEDLVEVKITSVLKTEMRRHFEHAFQRVSPKYRMVLVNILDLLLDEPGGAIVVICDEAFAKGLRFSEVDQGALRGCFMEFGRSVVKEYHRFKSILRAFRTHSETDRWVKPVVERLARDLRQSSDSATLGALFKGEGHPADGALLISLKAQVLGAAAHFKHSCPFKLVRQDGLGLGTRHQGGLSVAVRLAGQTGAVLIASSAGGVTLLLPAEDADTAPRAYRASPAR